MNIKGGGEGWGQDGLHREYTMHKDEYDSQVVEDYYRAHIPEYYPGGNEMGAEGRELGYGEKITVELENTNKRVSLVLDRLASLHDGLLGPLPTVDATKDISSGASPTAWVHNAMDLLGGMNRKLNELEDYLQRLEQEFSTVLNAG